jgi:K+:H+ antiporter
VSDRQERGIFRVSAIYAGLVIVPSLVALALLDAHRGKGPQTPRMAASMSVNSGAVFSKLLLAVAVIVIACVAVGAVLRRFGQPAVIGEILTGVLLGPSVFGALWPQGFHYLLPAEIMPPLSTLAGLGVIFFVFVAGLEVDTRLLRRRSKDRASVSE